MLSESFVLERRYLVVPEQRGEIHVYLTMTPELFREASLRFEYYCWGGGSRTSMDSWPVGCFLLDHLI
jgi:hypothetical protein